MATALTEFWGDILPEVSGCPNPSVNKAIIDTVRDLCGYSKVWVERLTPISTVVIEEAPDIAFVSGSPCTITSTSSDFSSAGFTSSDEIITDHETSSTDEKDNTGPYTLNTVATNTLTLESTDSLSSETAGDTTTIAKCAYSLSHTSGDIVHVTDAKFDGEQIFPKTEDWLEVNVPNWRTEMQAYPEFYTVNMKSKLIRLVNVPNEAIANALEVWVALKPLTSATTVEDFLYSEYGEIIAFGALARLLKKSGQSWFNPEAANLNYSLYLDGRSQARREGRIGLTDAHEDMEA